MNECKNSRLEVNECLNKIKHEYVLKVESMDTMKHDVIDMKNVWSTRLWADVCNGSISNSSNIQAMAQIKNVDNIDDQELKEPERRSKNIVIRGIQKEKMETPTSLKHAIGELFNKYYGMNIFGAHRVGKQGVSCSGERPTVCTMLDETKRRIIL